MIYLSTKVPCKGVLKGDFKDCLNKADNIALLFILIEQCVS
jgi:hypothetical protein